MKIRDSVVLLAVASIMAACSPADENAAQQTAEPDLSLATEQPAPESVYTDTAPIETIPTNPMPIESPINNPEIVVPVIPQTTEPTLDLNAPVDEIMDEQ